MSAGRPGHHADLRREYPILEFDPAREAVIEPSKVVEPGDVPEHCVMCFFIEVFDKLRTGHSAREIGGVRSEVGEHPFVHTSCVL